MKTDFTHTPTGLIDIRKVEMEAARLRAEAIVDTFAALGRLIGRGLAPVGRWLSATREASRIRRELALMSDRDLLDIGIHRADIPAIVAGVFSRPEPAPLRAVETSRPAAPATAEPEYRRAA